MFDESKISIFIVDDEYVSYVFRRVETMNYNEEHTIFTSTDLFVKPLLITTTTGYVIVAYGPCLSDSSNNDAAIQKDILIKNKDDILNWIAEHDLAVVERSFRDSTRMMRALGLDVCMSDFLNARCRFDALEANGLHFFSKIRWVSESANGRVKHFK